MIKLITHTDLDGVSCYIIAKVLLTEYVDVSFCDYSNVNDEALKVINENNKYSKIYITDISVNEEVANRLDSIKDKVKLLDHHPTAEFLNKYDWAKVETKCIAGKKSCGAYLLYQELSSDFNFELAHYVELVRLYDTWEWKEKNALKSKQLNDLLYIYQRDLFIKKIYSKLILKKSIFDAETKLLLDIRQNEIDEYINKKSKILIETVIGKYNVGVIFADNFISELGNKLCEMNPELDFIAIVGQKAISYRTVKDNIDLSKFAKKYGGGGHPKASGSPVDKDTIISFINNIFGTKGE